jgi:hypothetical protein
MLWVQVTHDGTTVTVKNMLGTSGGDPAGADWSLGRLNGGVDTYRTIGVAVVPG